MAGERNAAWYGRNWCRPSTRLVIYLRDGLACVFCQAGLEDGTRLTLDHVRPVERGGTNDPANLVTACATCNAAKGTLPVGAFIGRLVTRTGEAAEAVYRRLRRHRRRRLPRRTAREVLRQRGGLTAALEAVIKEGLQ